MVCNTNIDRPFRNLCRRLATSPCHGGRNANGPSFGNHSLRSILIVCQTLERDDDWTRSGNGRHAEVMLSRRALHAEQEPLWLV
jgi:hypothetical protein